MPTDDILFDIDTDELESMVLRLLTYRGREGVLLALVVMYESLIVLTSKRDCLSYASAYSLKKVYRLGYTQLCSIRNLVCHAMYKEDDIKTAVSNLISSGTVHELYRRILKGRYSKDDMYKFNTKLRKYAES